MMLPYIIKVLVCSGVLYGYYAMALKNSTLHTWNRVFLLMAPVLALVLPLIQFPFVQQGMVMKMLEVRAYASAPAAAEGASFDVGTLLCTLYILVGVGFLVRMALNWRYLRLLVLQGEIKEDAGYKVIRHAAVESPFSFFNQIFLHDMPSEQVLRHELAHVQGYHTIDKLWMEIVCAAGWCNPFFYLMKKELAMVHEFIADKEAAANMQADYAKLLLQTVLQTASLAGVSTFGQSPVKRRITMLFADKPSFIWLKKTIIIPIAIVLLLMMGSQRPTMAVASPAAMDEIFSFVEHPPVYVGGEAELAKYLSQNIHYPKEAQKAGVKGTVFVQFVVGADGVIHDVKTVGKQHGYGLEEESIRVVQTMPRWVPGTQEGKKVSVMFNLPIRYEVEL